MKFIKRSLVTVVLSTCIALGVAVGTWLIYSEAAQSRNMMNEMIKANIAQLSDLIALPVKIKDRLAIVRLIEGSSLRESASAIELRDSGNLQLYKFPEIQGPSSCPGTQISHPLTYSAETVGTLTVCLKSVGKINTRSALLIAMSVIIAVAILATTLVLRINREMGSIYSLMQDLERIDSMNMRIPLRAHTNRDLDKVLRKIHSLFERVHSEALAFQQVSQEAAIGKMAAQVAHDIRSPLGALKIVAAKAKDLSLEQSGIISESVSRIEGIAVNLLEKERSAINLNSNQTSYSLTRLVRNLIEVKKWEFANSPKVELIFHETNDEIEVIGDPVRIERVASNLINNSVEALGADGNIEIRVFKADRFACISIADNGPGIPPDLIAKIGKQRVTSKKLGSGFGLFAGFQIIESIGGSIEVTSSSTGTSILIKVPS